MGDEQGWCTIESDPGVFTALLKEIGVEGVQVEELYSLDGSQLLQLGKVHGLVFLFKYRQNEGRLSATRPGTIMNPVPDGLFFAEQTIQNACATVALLSIAMNGALEPGAELRRLKEFTRGMDPTTIGMVLSNSEIIRGTHNSFSGQMGVVGADDADSEKEDAFHFVAYVRHGDAVYELDGLAPGPRHVGVVKDETGTDDAWAKVAMDVIVARIQEYEDAEIRFNVMAVVEDGRERIKALLQNMEEGDRKTELGNELNRLEMRHRDWEVENARRRWNFVPFMMELLKAVAAGGAVDDLIADASGQRQRYLEAARGNVSKTDFNAEKGDG